MGVSLQTEVCNINYVSYLHFELLKTFKLINYFPSRHKKSLNDDVHPAVLLVFQTSLLNLSSHNVKSSLIEKIESEISLRFPVIKIFASTIFFLSQLFFNLHLLEDNTAALHNRKSDSFF